MKSSRRTVSIALPSRSEPRSPRRPSSRTFASRSRLKSSSLLTGGLGGGMNHPLTTRIRLGSRPLLGRLGGGAMQAERDDPDADAEQAQLDRVEHRAVG